MKKITLTLLFTLITALGYSQIEYLRKIEIGYNSFKNNTLDIDPGPGWKGYYLNDEDGFDLNIINGFNYNHKLFAGIGFGYLNFEGKNGLSIFSDFEYLPLKTGLTPLINLKIGYSHLWNQYRNGSGTGFVELCFGVNFKLTEKTDIYAKSGFTMTQQSLLIPVKIGIRF